MPRRPNPAAARLRRVLAVALLVLVPVACRTSDVTFEVATTTTLAPATTTPQPTAEPEPQGVAGAPGAGDPYFPDIGNGGYDVDSYDIVLEWLPDTGAIEATTTVLLTPEVDLDTFNLDLVGLDVHGVLVDGTPAPHVREGRELIIDPAPVLVADREVSVTVSYGGVPTPIRLGSEIFGAGWQTDGRDAYVVSEPAGAATWFPGNDHPTDKATFRFELTVPADLVAIANGVLVSERTLPDGRRTFVWRSDDPMATYLASMVVGDLVIEEGTAPTGLPLRDAYPRRLAELARADFGPAGEMIAVFEDWFGPYPFEVYGHVVVDEVLGFALENQTLSLFGSDLITGTGALERMVAHELAHQWFGNWVSPSTWRDIWLNEGFATYAEWIWDQERGGVDIEATARRAHRFADYGVPPGEPGPEELFQATVYVRGGLAVHALSVAMGDEAFRALLREWPDRYGGGVASTDDLRALAEEISGLDLGPLFDEWVYGAALPAFPES